jgi:hypothetical protein
MAKRLRDYVPALKYGAEIVTEDIANRAVNGAKLSTGVGYYTIAVNTNGETPVSVFGASGLGTAATITGVYLVSLDTTGGNITVENPAASVVVTIAKGSSTGALVGGTTLADTAVAAGTNVIVKSSSAGNARVFITFTVA